MSDLTVAGDALQSAASRMAEWVHDNDPPYEVHMAANEAMLAIEAWTQARRRWTKAGPPEERG